MRTQRGHRVRHQEDREVKRQRIMCAGWWAASRGNDLIDGATGNTGDGEGGRKGLRK